MNFIKNLLGLVIPSIAAQNIIQANEYTYHKLRNNVPDKNEHDYLAMTYKLRRKSRVLMGLDSITEEELSIISYTETRSFSILTPPTSIRGLALYILYKERPELISNKLSAEYSEIMEPIIKAEKEGSFEEWYSKTNP